MTVSGKSINCLIVTGVILYGLIFINACMMNEVKEDAEITVVKEFPNKKSVATTYIISGGGGGYVYKLVNIRNKTELFDSNKGIIFQISGI